MPSLSRLPRNDAMSFYQKNIEVFKSRSPEAGARVEAAAGDGCRFWIEESTVSGAVTARVRAGGDMRYVHSRRDPVREAAKLCEPVAGSSDAVYVLGVGLGYILAELQESLPDGKPLIIFERHPEFVAAAFERFDLTRLMQFPNVHFVTGLEIPEGIPDMSGSEVLTIRNLALIRLSPEYYVAAENSIRQPAVELALPAQPGRPSVLVICLDSLRRDRIGLFGADQELCPTPVLDAFFRDSILIDAITMSTWTPTVIASIFTGRAPWEHGVLTETRQLHKPTLRLNRRLDLPATALTLLERYRVLLSTNGWVHEKFGFARGFHQFKSGQGFGDEEFYEGLETVITSLGKVSSLTFLHLMETHQPFFTFPDLQSDITLIRQKVREDERRDSMYRRTLCEEIQLYNSSVMAADRLLGRVFAALESAGILETTIVAVFSDHGEELREHGRLRWPRHAHSLFEELLRVPLMIRVPAQMKSSVAAALDGYAGREFQLRYLFPLLHAIAECGEVKSEWFDDGTVSYLGYLRQIAAIRRGGFKLVKDLGSGVCELYNYGEDPREHLRFSPDCAVAKSMLDELDSIIPPVYDLRLEKYPEGFDDDDEVKLIQERLFGLGYL